MRVTLALPAKGARLSVSSGRRGGSAFEPLLAAPPQPKSCRARKLVTVIPVAEHVQRISISPDGRRVFTSDQRAPRLAVIDTASNKVAEWIPLPSTGYGTAPTPDGRMLVVAMPRANQVAVVDLRSRSVAHVIDVPPTPQMALMRPDGRMVYVSCDRSGQIAAIRTSDWKLETLIPAGKDADGLAWAR